MSDWSRNPYLDALFRARDLVDEHGDAHLLVASAESQDLLFKWMCHVQSPSLNILDTTFVADQFLGTHAEGCGLFDVVPEMARSVMAKIALTMEFETEWVLDLGRRMQKGEHRVLFEDMWVVRFCSFAFWCDEMLLIMFEIVVYCTYSRCTKQVTDAFSFRAGRVYGSFCPQDVRASRLGTSSATAFGVRSGFQVFRPLHVLDRRYVSRGRGIVEPRRHRDVRESQGNAGGGDL